MELEAIIQGVGDLGLPKSRLHEGLDTVRKLLVNVRSHPTEGKFRQIKLTNPAIQSRCFPLCFDLLRAAGFEDQEETLVYRRDPVPESTLAEVIAVLESVLLSLGDDAAPGLAQRAPQVSTPTASTSSNTIQPSLSSSSASRSKQTAAALKQQRLRQEMLKGQADAQSQLEALRKARASQYAEQTDVALAHHLSGRAAEQPYDPISALNASRGATFSFLTCDRCGCSLRYNSTTRAQAVLCPCGNLLRPLHLQGQHWHPSSSADLPIEPGEPVDSDNRPRASRGPFITVRGPDGEQMWLPLHSVLQMVRSHEAQRMAGACDETIEALPTRVFAAAHEGNCDKGEDTKCQICIEEFIQGDELRTLPCFHLFHTACVDQWLKVNSVCPTCRHKV